MKTILSKLSEIPQIKLRFSLLQFLFYGACAAYYPFLVIYLQSLGFSNTIVGTIIAINSFIMILSPIFWGIVSDWMRSARKVFVICMAAASILLLSLPFLESVILIGFILAAVTFFESTLWPLLDSWVVHGIKDHPSKINYGSIRLWGSVGYSLMVYLFTLLIDATSISIVFPFYGLMGFFAIMSTFGIKSDSAPQPVRFRDLNVGRLFKNYNYIVLLLFAIIIMIPHRATFIFLPNIIESVGGRREQVGILFSIVALSEIPMFILSAKLMHKFKPVHLILISAIFFILRQFLYFIAVTPLHVMLVQLTHGPSFALYFTGLVYYVYSLAPAELKATAQTMTSSISFGISGIIGSYGGGWFIDNFGLTSMYYLGIFISLGISLLFLASFPLGKLLAKRSPALRSDNR